MVPDYNASAEMHDEMQALEKVQAAAKARRAQAASAEDIGVMMRQELAKMAKKYIMIPAITTLTGAGGILGYYEMQVSPRRQEQAVTVEQAMRQEDRDEVDSVETRVALLEAGLAKAQLADTILVDILLKLQVQTADSHDHIAKKLDASSVAARKVDDEPDSVWNGRTRAAKIKNSKTYTPPEYDPSNPLAALAK